MSLWFGDQLKSLIVDVSPENIYKADELGLFWRMQANATYKIKDAVCKLGKQSQERMTMFLAANMFGTDKLPLLVIG